MINTSNSLIVALFCVAAASCQQHLVCKTLEGVFTEDAVAHSVSRGRIQGPPGKAGVPGRPGRDGSTGPMGPPAVVDYDRISEMIDQRITEGLDKMTSKINRLETNITALRKETGAICKENGGIALRGKCFTIPYLSLSKDMYYSKAEAECTRHGAQLAEVHDPAQFESLYDFVLAQGRRWVDVWIGMRYDPETNNLQYRSGKHLPYSRLNWHPGHPSGSATRINIAVRNYGTSVGLWIANENHLSHGVVCENDL